MDISRSMRYPTLHGVTGLDDNLGASVRLEDSPGPLLVDRLGWDWGKEVGELERRGESETDALIVFRLLDRSALISSPLIALGCCCDRHR